MYLSIVKRYPIHSTLEILLFYAQRKGGIQLDYKLRETCEVNVIVN